MSLFTWSDRYSVGIPQIDNEHKTLVNLLNELYNAMSNKKGNEALYGIIKELVKYTRTHFASEEQYMRRYDYPELEAHKILHQDFVRKIEEFARDFNAGKLSLSVNMLTFLKDWLIKHISGEDQKYSKHFKATGVIK